MVEHGQFDLRFQVDVTRAETSGRYGLGVQVAERLRHLATDADTTAQRQFLGRQVKAFVQRTAFQLATHTHVVQLITSPPVGVQTAAMKVSVCPSLSTCLSALVSQKTRVQTSRNFQHMLPMALARCSSDDTAKFYALLVLWMTSCLPIIGQAKATPTGRESKRLTRTEVPVTGPKYDIYNCLVLVTGAP